MKRISYIFLVLLLGISLILTACGGGDVTEPEPKQLTAPFVSISDSGLASWSAIDNARGYTYKIDGGDEKNTTALSVQLTNGQSIQVKAVGDGTNYTDSVYSSAQTYTAHQGTVTPTALSVPVVTVDNNGIASWSAIDNASGYKYKIDNGAEQTATALSVQLTNGQSIQVKAVGDGANYTDSIYSAAKSYTVQQGAVTPAALSVPVVTVDNNGVASWPPVPNASGYKYKIDNGAEQTATALSVQLTNGQSIQVKAVGDGTNHLDSAYSASKAYNAQGSILPTGTEPAYLGILASSTAPTAANGVPDGISPSVRLSSLSALYGGGYRSFGDAVDELFESPSNHLGSTYPVGSEYSLYSAPNRIVYIQIWLNNPDQHTILSLKLNGTKYQVSGGLSSFFIDKGGVHYNCVYIGVTVPADTYESITYEVSDIEYVSGTFINQDGTDEFMNNNDTITIGLPYDAQMPTASDFAVSDCTHNSISMSFTLSDKALADLCGGWLGIAVYDGYNIVKNFAVTVGANSFDITGLVEDSYYNVYIYLYGDLHDGRGVCAHTVYQDTFYTESAFETFEVEGVTVYDDTLERYLGKIKFNVTFSSTTAQFIKVEIYDDDYESPELITTIEDFTGTAAISNGIFNEASYNVKVYYRDNEYPEGRCREESVWITSLGGVYKYDEEYYSVYNDLVFNFTLGNNDENYAHVNSFTMYVYNDNLPCYWADLILAYLNDPGIIEDLGAQAQAKWDLMYQANINGDYDLGERYLAEYQVLIDEKSKYENAKYALETRFENNTDVSYWETESAKSKYVYTLTYDSMTSSDIFKVGKVYYAVLEDFYALDDWQQYQYEISASIDRNDGGALTQDTYHGSMHHTHIFTQFNGLITKDIVIGSNSIGYKLYNQDCYDNAGEYYNADLGYVWKIVASRGYQYSDDYREVTLYETAEAPAFAANGDEWLAAYIAAVKSGDDTSTLISQYVGDYDGSYSLPVDFSALTAHGHWDIHIYTRLYLESYTDDDPYDHDNSTVYLKEIRVETPSIKFVGHDAVVEFPDDRNYMVYYNVKNANGELIVEDQIGEPQYYMEAIGYQIQARLESYEDGLTASEWSEWMTFDGIKLVLYYNDYDMGSCTVSWYSPDEVSEWIYKLNGGEEIVLPLESGSPMLSNGDVLEVMAVAPPNTDYVNSDWTKFVCTDTRTPVATPENLTFTNNGGEYRLEWTISNAENISEFRVFVDGVQAVDMYARQGEGSNWYCSVYKLTPGAEYTVQAIASDTDNYRNSVFSNAAIPEITLTDPTLSSATDTQIRWSSVQYAESYWYKINGDGVETQANESSPTRTRLDISGLDLHSGDEIWLQARAEGATSSNWVLLWTKS